MQSFNNIRECGKRLGFEFQPGIYRTNKYDYALFTMEIENSENVRLTVGAHWSYGSSNSFSKEALQDMINDLQFICDNMEDS